MRALPDNNLKYPVLISFEDGGTGSGFFLNNSDQSLYLVTAKHVLFNPENSLLRTKSIKITSYAEDSKIKDPIVFGLDLETLSKQGFVVADDEHDIVVVKIMSGTIEIKGQKLSNPCKGVSKIKFPPGATLIVAEKLMCKKYDDVLIANDAFILGYPTSIGSKKYPQIDYQKPLIKKGIIAGKNESKKTIILDCEVYYGNSGGIVIELEQLDLSIKRPWVIGIVSELIIFSKKWDQNSGYSVVVPIDYALEIIKKID